MVSYKIHYFSVVFLIAASFIGCRQNTPSTENSERSDNADISENFISVITTAMNFQVVTEIPSGWNTFRYQNYSQQTHFFILEKLPEGIRLENYKNELIPPFMEGFKYFNQGDMEAGMKEMEKIPSWFSEVEVAGGVGLTSPGQYGESTLKLEPGVYAMECYVRMPDGMAHAFLGMLEEIVVTDSSSGMVEPKADLQISVSSEQGIQFKDSITTGNYQFAVKFIDQKQYETLLGHDVNLVKVDSNASIDTLAKWINAADIMAFRSPAPTGFTFFGGVQDLPAGNTGYFRANLDPGHYLLISEVPEAIARNMIKQFWVTPTAITIADLKVRGYFNSQKITHSSLLIPEK